MKNSLTDLVFPTEKLFGIYRGVVECNNSPGEDGKCQIRVFGIHTEDINDMPTEHLPWAEPATPIFGGISKVGIFGVPCQGAHVFLFFEGGNPQNPRYFATAPKHPYTLPDISFGFNDPAGEYPKKSCMFQTDWNKGDNSTTEYPNNFVISTKSGHMLEMDDTPGAERIILMHASGHGIELTSDGSFIQYSRGHSNKSITENQEQTIGGDLTTNVTNAITQMSKDLKVTITGLKKELVSGSITSTCLAKSSQKAEEIEINSTGDSSSIAGGANALIAGDNITIKSKEKSVVMEAPIDVGIKGDISASVTGLVSCDINSMIMTTIEGKVNCSVKGRMTTINGDAIMKVTGGIIMIG